MGLKGFLENIQIHGARRRQNFHKIFARNWLMREILKTSLQGNGHCAKKPLYKVLGLPKTYFTLSLTLLITVVQNGSKVSHWVAISNTNKFSLINLTRSSHQQITYLTKATKRLFQVSFLMLYWPRGELKIQSPLHDILNVWHCDNLNLYSGK